MIRFLGLLGAVALISGCVSARAPAEPIVMSDADVIAACPAFRGTSFQRIEKGVIEDLRLLYPGARLALFVNAKQEQCNCTAKRGEATPTCKYVSKAEQDARAKARAERRVVQGVSSSTPRSSVSPVQ